MWKKVIVLLLLVFVVVVATLLFKSEPDEVAEDVDGFEDVNNEIEEFLEEEQVIEEVAEDLSAEEIIKKQIKEMTIDEKIGQLIIAGVSSTSITENDKKLIGQYKIGGFIFFAPNLTGPEQTVQLLNEIKAENTNNDIPLLLSLDQEGGRVTRLPSLVDMPTNKQIGNKNDSNFSYEIGKLLGKQLNAFGFQLNYAPVLDVNSNPNNPVIGDRSFGDDSEVVSELGVRTMKGMQSERVIPVVKHFPGHGDTHVDSHVDLPVVNKNLDELNQVELIPFKRAIEEGVDVVMVAHILLPKLGAELPATMAKEVITDLLRDSLNFDGVVVTDDMTMGAITNQYGIAHAAIESIKAGTDIVMVAHEYDLTVSVFNALKEAVEQGEITEARLDESVYRILRLKAKYELNNELIDGINIEQLNEMIKELR